MLKFNTRLQNDMLRTLSADEIEFVAGGVKPGRNGEDCTGPRRPPKEGQSIPTGSR